MNTPIQPQRPLSESPTFERAVESAVQRFGTRWESLRGAKLFITGGTGYFGRWLLRTLVRADETHNLKLHVTILTRSPDSFLSREPFLARRPSISVSTGDIRNFDFPEGEFTHLIHGAATSAEATFHRWEDPLAKFDTTLDGTRRVLDFAVARGIPRLLMLSSGSYYGPLPSDRAAYSEDEFAAPPVGNLDAAIGQAKRAAEFLCACYADRHDLSFSTARCFSFVGPFLPLNLHYAIGNFIRDALWGEAITVAGNGTPVRSYMYTGDLMVWLLTLLTDGEHGRAYNVGSDHPIAIARLAELVRELLAPSKDLRILGETVAASPRNIYVPNVSRARNELGLDLWTPLEEAVRLTAHTALETANSPQLHPSFPLT